MQITHNGEYIKNSKKISKNLIFWWGWVVRVNDITSYSFDSSHKQFSWNIEEFSFFFSDFILFVWTSELKIQLFLIFESMLYHPKKLKFSHNTHFCILLNGYFYSWFRRILFILDANRKNVTKKTSMNVSNTRRLNVNQITKLDVFFLGHALPNFNHFWQNFNHDLKNHFFYLVKMIKIWWKNDWNQVVVIKIRWSMINCR